jgi:hypothetical protein
VTAQSAVEELGRYFCPPGTRGAAPLMYSNHAMDVRGHGGYDGAVTRQLLKELGFDGALSHFGSATTCDYSATLSSLGLTNTQDQYEGQAGPISRSP